VPVSCDGCSECCKLGIPELNKPAGPWCRYVHHGDYNIKSCSIYAERPPSCRSFECHWLISQTQQDAAGRIAPMQPEARPDRSHVVLVMDIFALHDVVPNGERILFAHCDPKYPDAWRRGRIKQAIETFLCRGGTVLVLIGRNRVLKRPGYDWLFGKHEDIEVAMAQVPALLSNSPSAPRTETAVPRMYGVHGGGRPTDATFSVPELMRRR
jgi:hypothetical protein